MKRSQVKYLLIHCSDSSWGDAAEIKRWHTLPKPKGNGWDDIGYHYVIQNQFPTYQSKTKNKPDAKSDGLIVKGRANDVVGSHAKGFNDKSLGICCVGIDKFTTAQREALVSLIADLMHEYSIPVENVLGHCETPLSGGKTCPNMDMDDLRREVDESINGDGNG